MDERVSGLEEITGKHSKEIQLLHTGVETLHKNYDFMVTTIQGIQQQISTQTENTTKQLTETNVRVEGVSKDIGQIRTDMAQHQGTVTALISQNSENVNWMRQQITSNQQTAADIEKTQITTKAEVRRNFFDNFFRWAGILVTSGAAIIGAIAGIAKLFQ